MTCSKGPQPREAVVSESESEILSVNVLLDMHGGHSASRVLHSYCCIIL